MVTEICHFTNVPDISSSKRFEEVNTFSLALMISKGAIGPGELHIPMLSLASVVVRSVRLEFVSVPVLGTAFAGEQEDDGVILGS